MIAVSEIFRNQHEQFAERSLPGAGTDILPAIPALIARGQQTLDRFFQWLDSYTSQSDYVAGDNYSMADITALCAVDFAGWVDIEIPAQHRSTKQWYERVSSRASARA